MCINNFWLNYKMMRLFKRRSSDPNPHLESLAALSETDGSNELKNASRVPSIEHVEPQKTSLSSWGKTWEKLKRQDSSESLPHKSKKRNWSPLRREKSSESYSSNLPNENLTFSEIFTKGNSGNLKITDDDVKKVYDMYKNVSNGHTMRDRPLRNAIRCKRNIKCVSDNIELNQQQFLDYLMLMKPNSEELDNLFGGEKSEDDLRSPKLGSLSEEKKSRRSKIRSMFTKRSSSKSDDESEISFKKINKKSSSTDSLTSILNFIMPKRRNTSKSPTMGTKFKSDESGYGSDCTKANTMDSPIGSIKSQTSQTSHEVDTDGEMDKTLQNKDMGPHRDRHEYSDDTDTADDDMELETTYTFSKFYGRSPTKSQNKKRARSHSRESELNQNSLKRRSVRLKKSPSIKENPKEYRNEMNDINQLCCDPMKNLKIADNNKRFDVGEKSNGEKREKAEVLVDKEFKCVRLKVRKNEMIGVKISPQYGKNYNNNNCSYTISEILPNSVASRNEHLQVGDEVIKVNGVRIKGLPDHIVKTHFVPKNDELEIVISRISSKSLKKRTNSFKAFLSNPSALLSPKKELSTKKEFSPKKELCPKKEFSPSKPTSSILKSPSTISFNSVTSPKAIAHRSDYSSPKKNVFPKEEGFSPLKKSQSSTSPNKKFVGLSDILISSPDIETKVTFSEKMPKEREQKTNGLIEREVVRGKPPLYLKSEEKDIFKSPSPVNRRVNPSTSFQSRYTSSKPGPNVRKFENIPPSPKLSIRKSPSYNNTPRQNSTTLRSPSPKLYQNRPKTSPPSPKSSQSPSPSPHGMRKFSLSSSSRSQIFKSIVIPTKTNSTRSPKMSDKIVTFVKGPGQKSLGFSIVGGKDSPKGPMGIYVKTVFKDGQASDCRILQEGDELLKINGTSFQGMSHLEAVTLFKSIKCGEVIMEVASRHPFRMYSHSL